MSMKKSAILMALAAFAMASDPRVMGCNDEPKPKRRTMSANERRKCFYKPCKNMRPNATDLYCCDECKTKAREFNYYK